MQVGQLPPGPETGNFYIPICNVCFTNTSSAFWPSDSRPSYHSTQDGRRLRNGLAATVKSTTFNSTTPPRAGSGSRGHTIFIVHVVGGQIEACPGPANTRSDRLKDGVFNGRRIIYDDSNMTSAIVVKEVHNDENAIPVNGTVKSRQPTPAPFSAQIDHQPSPYSYASSEASSFEQQVRA